MLRLSFFKIVHLYPTPWTLQESLAVLNLVRADIDLEKGRLERQISEHDADLEVCVRTKQNAWLVVRARGGQELYTVQERAGDTLLLASDAVEKLSKRSVFSVYFIYYCSCYI